MSGDCCSMATKTSEQHRQRHYYQCCNPGEFLTARLVIEPFVRGVVANIFDRVADDLLIVKVRFCGDFSKDHNHAWRNSVPVKIKGW
jgi:hypothetical protein